MKWVMDYFCCIHVVFKKTTPALLRNQFHNLLLLCFLSPGACWCINGSHTHTLWWELQLKTLWWKLHLSLFILFSGLFASNYTETHYLEDGTVVTGSHNFTVRFFVFFFLITFDTINLFSEFPTSAMNRSTSSLFYFKSPTQQLLLLAFSFLKRLYCVGFRQRKSRFCTETHFSILLEIVLCGEDASIGDRAHFLTHIWWNKQREEVREQSEF